jgi:uncharacterized protein YjgD (DUF1641 family)
MNALEQLLHQTQITAYRLSKETGVSEQTISYQRKKKYNIDFAIKLASLLKKSGFLKQRIVLSEFKRITKI